MSVTNQVLRGEGTNHRRGVGGRRCSAAGEVGRGDARSLMCHNASTTHYSVSPEARDEMGVTEGMLRINVGLEDSDDVIDDLDQALKRAGL